MNAMTAAWVTQVSGRPPLVLVAVGKTHYTSELIAEAGAFSVNVLRSDQYDLARRCGFGSGRQTDRLAGVEVALRATGAPVLTECAAHLDCKVVERLEAGDHHLFIGEVVEGSDTGAPAMVYRSADFF
jgi:flavin reductase (DIM6/NTAB) family NADH-FMN oxidoreductase RutF